METGVFVYECTYITFDGKKGHKVGDVTLIK
jgi:hypothetical protein